MAEIDTAELLARDLENIAERLREGDCTVNNVETYGEISDTKTEYVEFEVEWY